MSVRPGPRSPYGMPDGVLHDLIACSGALFGGGMRVILALSATGLRTRGRLSSDLHDTPIEFTLARLAERELIVLPGSHADPIQLTARGRRWAAALRELASFNDAPERDGASTVSSVGRTEPMAAKTTTKGKAAAKSKAETTKAKVPVKRTAEKKPVTQKRGGKGGR